MGYFTIAKFEDESAIPAIVPDQALVAAQTHDGIGRLQQNPGGLH